MNLLPKTYDPPHPFGGPLAGDALSRTEYIAMCDSLRISALTDEAIRSKSWLFTDASPTGQEWDAKTRDERVVFHLGRRRMAALEAEKKTEAETRISRQKFSSDAAVEKWCRLCGGPVSGPGTICGEC